MLEVRQLDWWSIKDIIREARREDREEYEALKGTHWGTIGENLRAAANSEQHVSSSLWTPDDRLVAVGGFSMNGLCWFLCTDRVEEHPVGFSKHILKNRQMVHSFGGTCTNVLGLNNELHVKFIKWLGAEISPKIYHKGGWDFARFYIPPPIGGLDV